ncbi:MAG: hypothetical protein EAZ36_06920, partial [Verrucomicrobia bacterium]
TAVRTKGGQGNRAPLDLREAFIHGRTLAENYGDLVDAWEFENEPDISFFADNADVFAALHKAIALGLAERRRSRSRQLSATNSAPDAAPYADAEAPATASAVSPQLEWGRALGQAARPGLLREYPRNPRLRFAAGSAPRRPITPPERSLILMAAPALPPGPHFAQLLENGYLNYTEGFNYHYYGFAMDYTGVHEQFRRAVAEFSPGAMHGADNRKRAKTNLRRLPVFLTEWGYSLLDGYDAQTVEGRVRQWRYFAEVGEHNARLRMAAPLAFLLRPYFELAAKEFGLSLPTADARAAHYGFSLLDAGGDSTDAATATGRAFSAGGLTFTPEDFGLTQVAPWMKRIGERVGDAEASPALAWLLEQATTGIQETRGGAGGGLGWYGQAKRSSRDWLVRTERASPVVLDFIAGTDTLPVKTYQGYWVMGAAAAGESSPSAALHREGRGTLVVYNFGRETAEVSWVWPKGWAELSDVAAGSRAEFCARVAAGERLEIPVRLRIAAKAFLPEPAAISAAVNEGGNRTISRWASRFYADPADYGPKEQWDLMKFTEADARTNRAILLARPHAPEEPRLIEQGRWLVTDGVRVDETSEGWRIHIDRFPGQGIRPAVAELPLPDTWRLPAGATLSYSYRLKTATDAVDLTPAAPDARFRHQTGLAGAVAESYIRSQQGNLFSTVPRLAPTEGWKRYNQNGENLTLLFLGRTLPPWRFHDHTPAALVFFVRPVKLPAVFEVSNPKATRYGAPE